MCSRGKKKKQHRIQKWFEAHSVASTDPSKFPYWGESPIESIRGIQKKINKLVYFK